MRIFNRTLLDKFVDKHADAESALQRWISIAEEAKWESHNELKMDFPSADYVGKERYIFNIQGNNYRLVAIVLFIERYVRIRFIGTHAEYDKINCKTI